MATADVVQAQYEQLEEIARRFEAQAEAGQAMQRMLQQRVEALQGGGWIGQAADTFYTELEDVLWPGLTRCQDALLSAGQKVGQTITILRQAEAEAANSFAVVELKASDKTGASGDDNIVSANRARIQGKWDNMTIDERKIWLEGYYRSLCSKPGLIPTNFEIVDLPDPPGKDSQGKYRHGLWFGWLRSMKIDIDNVAGDDPFAVIETITHETQHQYQYYLVENPDKRPPNVSEKQIEIWKENFNNYRQSTDDFEAYWKQPVEQNARDAASQYLRDYLADNELII